MNILLPHFFYKVRKIRKFIWIKGEILEVFHIVYVHVDHIQRNMLTAVLIYHLSEILLCPVAPAALSETKGKFRSYVASSDYFPKLLYYI